jgi:hypothetical protein
VRAVSGCPVNGDACQYCARGTTPDIGVTAQPGQVQFLVRNPVDLALESATAPDTIALQVLDMLVTELPPMTGARPMTDFKPGVIMGILINQMRADCTCCGQWATYV